VIWHLAVGNPDVLVLQSPPFQDAEPLGAGSPGRPDTVATMVMVEPGTDSESATVGVRYGTVTDGGGGFETAAL
jgi:hypothetical protein